jgi:hypothetical protein
VRDMLRPTLRAIRWGGIAAVAVPATYLAWHLQNQQFLDTAAAGVGVRVAAIMITAGLAFSLDDPTEDTTGCAPISILKRRALRVALVLPIALAYWLLLRAWMAGAISAPGQELPTASMVVEFTALAFVGYAGAAIGTRVLSDRLGGLAGAGAVLLLTVILAVVPWGAGVLTRTPGSASDAEVHTAWVLVALISVLTCWRLSLPPGMPGLPRRSRRPAVTPVAVDRRRR